MRNLDHVLPCVTLKDRPPFKQQRLVFPSVLFVSCEHLGKLCAVRRAGCFRTGGGCILRGSRLGRRRSGLMQSDRCTCSSFAEGWRGRCGRERLDIVGSKRLDTTVKRTGSRGCLCSRPKQQTAFLDCLREMLATGGDENGDIVRQSEFARIC